MVDLTPEQASALHRGFLDCGKWLVWFVSTSTAERPGKAVAWAVVADTGGGTRQPGQLVADTLDELRAMLPAGLTRHERTMVMPRYVMETWD